MRVTVIGAGHGGQALAGYIAHKGCDVTIYNRTKSVLDGIEKNGGISLEGVISQKEITVSLTNNIADAVNNAEVILVCVPATAHRDIAKLIATHIKKTQIIILIPGRTLGAFFFKKDLIDNAAYELPIIAETDTFILTSRKLANGKSKIISFKDVVYLAAETKQESEYTCDILKPIFPKVTASDTQIYTSLANIGAIFHPIPAIFNIARIECKEEYLHYKQGITPSVAHLLELIDDERLALANRLGVPVPSAKEWLYNVYGSCGDNLYEALQTTDAYDEVVAPTEINTRYIYEDITTGLVPMYCLAKRLGTPHQLLEQIISLASVMFDYDFYHNGRYDVADFVEHYVRKQNTSKVT